MRFSDLARLICLVFTLACGLHSAPAQEKIHKATIVDSQNVSYRLTDFKISGTTVFHCRLKDTVFTLGFDKVRSIAVDTQAESPFLGFRLANFILADGRAARAYVDLDNYWLEGTEENFNVRIKIKLAEVVRLDLTGEARPPAPSPAPVPVPSPSGAPDASTPPPATSAYPLLPL